MYTYTTLIYFALNLSMQTEAWGVKITWISDLDKISFMNLDARSRSQRKKQMNVILKAFPYVHQVLHYTKRMAQVMKVPVVI